MAESKTYLNVPFAQKDEAKALGARWDAVPKKWFVPADKDITLFARWQAESGAVQSSGLKTSPAKTGSSSRKTAAGVSKPMQRLKILWPITAIRRLGINVGSQVGRAVRALIPGEARTARPTR